MESILTLGQNLLVYTLLRPLLPLPGQSYMDKTCIALNKNIPFTLVSNSKTLKMKQGFYGRVSFSTKLFQVALPGRDAGICLNDLSYSEVFAKILFSLFSFTS